MPNPTCPHCNQPMTAQNYLPLLVYGMVVIAVICPNRHQELMPVPLSRFEDAPKSATVNNVIAALFTMALPLV